METDKILLVLFATYGQEEKISRMKAYINLLAGYDVQALKLACEMLARKSKYLPSVAEIIETIEAQTGEIPALSWAAARAEIEKMMYRYGCTGKEPPFSNKAIAQTVKAMGGIDAWALCEGSRAIEYVWKNAEKVYAEYSKAASAGTARKELDSSDAARKLAEGMAMGKWILNG